MLTVYHGATDVISSPICAFGRPKLDFGMGFYVTDIKEVFELALLQEKVAHPLDLTVKKEEEKSTEEAKA